MPLPITQSKESMKTNKEVIFERTLKAKYSNLQPYIKTAEVQEKIDELFNWFTESRHQDLADIESDLNERIEKERSLKINRQTSVPSICKQAYGGAWVSHYYERHQGFISGLLTAVALLIRHSSIKIWQCKLNGEKIKSWDSIKEAAIAGNHKIPGISQCVNGIKYTHHGFTWKPFDESKVIQMPPRIRRCRYEINPLPTSEGKKETK